MDSWKKTRQRRMPEALMDLGLVLRDLMLDLDPGMLTWTPPQAR